MYVIVLYRNVSLYLRFLNFGIFSSTNFAENPNVSLFRNRILLNFKYYLSMLGHCGVCTDGL